MTTIRDILLNPAYIGDFVWNRLSFAKFHKIADGKAVQRHGIPSGGAEQNREDDWIVIPSAHPALITREQFELARTKWEDQRKTHSGQSYRVGQGAKSRYLLTGLIQCDRCKHYWQGYAVNKGKPRKDGTKVKTYFTRVTVTSRKVMPSATARSSRRKHWRTGYSIRSMTSFSAICMTGVKRNCGG